MVEQTRVTAAEFLELPETTQPTELIEWEIIVRPAPVPKHQRLTGRFYSRLNQLIPNGEVFISPIDLYLDEANVPQPDVVWVSENSRCKITEKRLEVPPELIVEIFSPGTAKRDKSDKYQLYQRHTIPEYWMVDPVGQYVEVCVLTNGRYEQQGVYGPDDSFISPILGDKMVELKGIFSS